MHAEIVNLLMEQPFERVMEIATRNNITVYNDPQRGDYYCEYPTCNADGVGRITTVNQKKIKLAVAYAIMSKLKEEPQDA